MSNFLNFVETVPKRGSVTKRWDVRSLKGDTLLGEVAWYSPWRRYAFQPRGGVLFDADCLAEMQAFLTKRTSERKLKWKKPARRN